MIIAIDGPAGAGKSTTAKRVAERLGYQFLDSGAMYRAVTLLVLANGDNPQDNEAAVNAARSADVHCVGKVNSRILVNGKDVTESIRTPFVTENIAAVAANPQVREILVAKQRLLAKEGDIVVEGRDIGTVVFPNADVKIYLQADVVERAKRRRKDLETQGLSVDFEQLVKDIKERDRSDQSRRYGALKKAKDAVVLDTTSLGIDEQVEAIVQLAKEREA